MGFDLKLSEYHRYPLWIQRDIPSVMFLALCVLLSSLHQTVVET